MLYPSLSFRNGNLWTPDLLDTTLWLDALDSNTVTITDGQVSLWEDKSGNNYHATPINTTSGFVYTGDSIYNDVLISTYGFKCSISAALGDVFSIYCVANKNSYSGTNDVALYMEGAATNKYSDTRNYLTYYALDQFPPSGADGLITYDTELTPEGEKNILEFKQTQSDYREFIRNGKIIFSTTEVYSPLTGANSILIGFNPRNISSQSPAYSFRGHIHELITIKSNNDQEKIEGYLAHKWGLESNLPVTHPYKNVPPRG